ncbi:MAG: sensor histidine kinase [Chitinophagales bacterium]
MLQLSDIIQFGVKRNMPFEQKRSIKLLNQFALAILFVALGFTLKTLLLRQWFLLPVDFSFISFALGILYAHYTNKGTFARVFFCVGTAILIVYGAIMTGENSKLNYIFFPSAVAPTLLFHHFRTKFSLFLINVIGFVSVEIYYFIETQTHLSSFMDFMPTINAVISLGLLFWGVNSLVKVNKNYANQIEKQNETLSSFAYIASHDIKEPLRSIRSFTQLIDRNIQRKNYDNLSEYIEYVNKGTRQLDTLINDVLNYSTLEQSVDYENCDLNHVLENVQDALQNLIQKHQAKIHSEVLPVLRGNPTQMLLLLQNLINNAIKFRRPDVLPVIRITTKESKTHWQINITDNGIGIEQDYQDKIFEMFKRLNSSKYYEGSGIGLAICKQIVDTHHGTIGCHSILGQGTTFWFTIDKELKNEFH